MLEKNQAISGTMSEKKSANHNQLHQFCIPLHDSPKLAITSNVLILKLLKQHSLSVMFQTLYSILMKHDQKEKIILLLNFIRVEYVC